MTVEEPPRRPSPPAINLPPLTGVLILLPVLVHLGRSLFVEADHLLYQVFVFVPGPFVTAAPLAWFDWTGLFGHWLLHASLMHLVMNMVMVAVFGRLLEPHWGPFRLAFLFLLSVAGGAMMEAWFGDITNGGMVGASGGAMGLTGALIGLSFSLPPQGRRMTAGLARLAWFLVIFNVVLPASGVFTLFDMNVSWLSHLGGAITGAGIGWVMERRLRQRYYS